MLHRDISVHNIMFQMRGKKYYFILNDFDMALVLRKDDGSPYTPSSKHRTGTLPFMAAALVHDAHIYMKDPKWIPTQHLLCHDYESLFWVCLWCALVLHMHSVSPSMQDIYISVVKDWEASSLFRVHAVKVALFGKRLKAHNIQLAPAAQCLEKWFNGWASLLHKATNKASAQDHSDSESDSPFQTSEIFDPDTAGGILSMENILRVLTPRMPFKQDDVEDDPEPYTPEVPAVAPKRRSRVKTVSAEATAAKAAIMSRLRPRKAT